TVVACHMIARLVITNAHSAAADRVDPEPAYATADRHVARMQARLDSQAFDAARIAHYYCAGGRREPDVADPQDAGETWRALSEPHDRTAVSDPPAFLSGPQGRTRRTLYPGQIQAAVSAE